MNLNNWKIQPKDVLNAGPVMPVMVIQNLDDAVPLAKALVAGGIKVLEITLRTPIALDAIRLISQEVKEAIVGAGTITTPEQLKAAEDAGAVFAISPGLTPSLLAAAKIGNIALIPGIASLSELMLGMEYGLDHFKFFPAEAAGGIRSNSSSNFLSNWWYISRKLQGLLKLKQCRLCWRFLASSRRCCKIQKLV